MCKKHIKIVQFFYFNHRFLKVDVMKQFRIILNIKTATKNDYSFSRFFFLLNSIVENSK